MAPPWLHPHMSQRQRLLAAAAALFMLVGVVTGAGA
jgi:hypothetical protein